VGAGWIFVSLFLFVAGFVAGLPAPALVLRRPRSTLAVYGAAALAMLVLQLAGGADRETAAISWVLILFGFGFGCALTTAVIAARMRRTADRQFAQMRSNAAGSSGSSQQPATRSPARR
jgi:cyanate permease